MSKVEDARKRDREALLDRITKNLQEDARVAAAWLAGSFGRGTADAWSDLDLWVVVPDESFSSYASSRYGLVRTFGDLVLTVQANQNGPPGGCYLMTGYDFPAGLQLVDWYWQPLAAARTPSEALFLKQSKELGTSPPPEVPPLVLWNPSPAEDATNCVSLAVAMIAIQAKYVEREPERRGLQFQAFIEQLLKNATGQPLEYGDAESIVDRAEKLDRLEPLRETLPLFAQSLANLPIRSSSS